LRTAKFSNQECSDEQQSFVSTSYARSSRPALTPNADGSLDIYVSAASPGKDKESNWLPAPSGPFWTVLRTYGPAQEIIDGAYKQLPYTPSH
jgi:hypothetical protein